MKVALIIAARTGSRRLPNKVLHPFCGTTPLSLLIHRLQRSKWRKGIVVATSNLPSDDAVAELAAREGVIVHRGSEADVLGRITDAARETGADIIVRLTADCPLNDPVVIDACVEAYRRSDADYVTTKYNFPMGIDCEVLGASLLDRLEREAPEGQQREHVTLRIWEESGFAKAFSLAAPSDLAAPDIVLTLDTKNDLERLELIALRLGNELVEASAQQILALVRAEPSLLCCRNVPTGFPTLEWPLAKDGA